MASSHLNHGSKYPWINHFIDAAGSGHAVNFHSDAAQKRGRNEEELMRTKRDEQINCFLKILCQTKAYLDLCTSSRYDFYG